MGKNGLLGFDFSNGWWRLKKKKEWLGLVLIFGYGKLGLG